MAGMSVVPAHHVVTDGVMTVLFVRAAEMLMLSTYIVAGMLKSTGMFATVMAVTRMLADAVVLALVMGMVTELLPTTTMGHAMSTPLTTTAGSPRNGMAADRAMGTTVTTQSVMTHFVAMVMGTMNARPVMMRWSALEALMIATQTEASTSISRASPAPQWTPQGARRNDGTRRCGLVALELSPECGATHLQLEAIRRHFISRAHQRGRSAPASLPRHVIRRPPHGGGRTPFHLHRHFISLRHRGGRWPPACVPSQRMRIEGKQVTCVS